MIIEIDRSKCRWRGLHIPTVRKALKTGKPAFAFRKWDSKCPICGVLFKMNYNTRHGYCSPSCSMKAYWRRKV